MPEIGPKDVLVYVMATGINYNNVWRLGYPVDVIATRQKKSRRLFMLVVLTSGIVYKVGDEVSNARLVMK